MPISMSAPKESTVVYAILVLHGVGTLLPWNMFITANDYFVQKLNVTDPDTGMVPSYGDNFLSWVGIASKMPNVAIQGTNFLFTSHSTPLRTRILWSIGIEAVIFMMTTGLAMLNTANSIGLFFWITMVSIVLINLANGVYQSCLYGSAALLPFKYMNAVTTGMNISGVVTSLFMVVFLFTTPDLRTSAIFYFMTAALYLVLAYATYLILERHPFYMYYVINKGSEDEKSSGPLPIEPSSQPLELRQKVRECWRIIKTIYPQLFNCFITYFTSLAVFPAVMVHIIPVKEWFSHPPSLYLVLFCFLSFNLFSMIGNIMADYIPKVPARLLIIPALLRVTFIPFFLMCNYLPPKVTRTLPIYFEHDMFFILGVALFSLSNGYVSSLAIMYAPKMVPPKDSSIAGMINSFALMIGIMLGIFSSLIFPHVV